MHADARDIMFKVKKQGRWESLDINRVHPVVSGKRYTLEEVKQEGSSIPGVFAFVNMQESGEVTTSTAMEAPPLWDGTNLTSKKLASMLEEFCDKVNV